MMNLLPFPLAALLLVPAALHAQPAPAAAQKDPVINLWRLDDGRIVRFSDDRKVVIWTPRKPGSTSGTWDADPFAEGIRRYQTDWRNGRVWSIEMAKDSSMLRISNPDGERLTANRVEEYMAYLMCNDEGGLDLNGTRMIGTPKKGKPETLFVRSGDVITFTVARKKGNAAFALEIFNGNKSVISAKDFVYHTAPDPGWQTNKDTTGFRPVDTEKMRGMSLGNVVAPLAADAKGADEKFDRLFFKYVVP